VDEDGETILGQDGNPQTINLGPQWPTFDEYRCTICEIDSYELDDGTCSFCSNVLDYCGRCTYDFVNTWQCDKCLGEVPMEDGRCGCEYVEYVDISQSDDRETAKCVTCLNKIDDCNACTQQMEPHIEDLIWDRTWDNDVVCTECRRPYFINETGKCTWDSCRETNAENECIACNEKNDVDWKTQEDICVPECTFPYSEIWDNHCGIDCNDGFYVGSTGCLPCNVDGCKHCITDGSCTYCHPEGHPDYDSSC
jgi:hypothetical protein